MYLKITLANHKIVRRYSPNYAHLIDLSTIGANIWRLFDGYLTGIWRLFDGYFTGIRGQAYQNVFSCFVPCSIRSSTALLSIPYGKSSRLLKQGAAAPSKTCLVT
jgi:hypothetical protein